MSTVLYNPTNETLVGTYVGEDTVIAPEAKVKVDDNRGRHILNQLGRRGLIALDYGDEGDVFKAKVKAAIAKNRAFKEKQVTDYNRTNSQNRANHMPYIPPTEQVEGYAKELGLELIQPYAPKDTRTPEIERLTEENRVKDRQIDELRTQISNQSGQISELTTMMQQFMAGQQAEKKKPGPKKKAETTAGATAE